MRTKKRRPNEPRRRGWHLQVLQVLVETGGKPNRFSAAIFHIFNIFRSTSHRALLVQVFQRCVSEEFPKIRISTEVLSESSTEFCWSYQFISNLITNLFAILRFNARSIRFTNFIIISLRNINTSCYNNGIPQNPTKRINRRAVRRK